MTLDEFFRTAVGEGPHPFQRRFAEAQDLYQLVDIPTGLGKTAMAILGWLWRRRYHPDETVRKTTPRRLVYCLPMHAGVEQIRDHAVLWLHHLGLLGGKVQCQSEDGGLRLRSYTPDFEDSAKVVVHVVAGGSEQTDWAMWPQREMILVGTQDMLLSRALNRGYAASCARWPLEFGLLNNDCLWVFDEIHLMDAGLASSLQLDAWRRSLRLRPSRTDVPRPTPKHAAGPCPSVWMSATMARHGLEQAVDWLPYVAPAWEGRLRLTETEQTDGQFRSGQLFQNRKRLDRLALLAGARPKNRGDQALTDGAGQEEAIYLERLADYVAQPRNQASSGLTLVIVNTMDRATKLLELLRKQPGLDSVPVRLMHGGFRPYERATWGNFLNRKDRSRRILVATQVVEAGVDVSAAVLYTELAPWASLVQRFGRCARVAGESGRIIWLDFELGTSRRPVARWARPYERSDLIAARDQLTGLCDAGLRSLALVKAQLDAPAGGAGAAPRLLPYAPRWVPRDKDLFDLFDTTADLGGADVDISCYIHDGATLNVQVFWREVPHRQEPRKKDRPHPGELCAVPFYRFREVLGALRRAGRVWRRHERRGWKLVGAFDAGHVYPGQVFLLEKSCGGYSPEYGWTGATHDAQFEVPPSMEPLDKQGGPADEKDAGDWSQAGAGWTVLEHTRRTCRRLDGMLADVREPTGLTASELKVLRLAARWHDRGRAHPAAEALGRGLVAAQRQPPSRSREKSLQAQWRPATLTVPERQAARGTGAKDQTHVHGAPDASRDRPSAKAGRVRRPGHRHELASALAILETLRAAQPTHQAFAWPSGLNRSDFGAEPGDPPPGVDPKALPLRELKDLTADELDLLVYLVAAHHGKVRMSLGRAPEDDRTDGADPCRCDQRQACGVRDGDILPACQIPAAEGQATEVLAPEVTLSLDPMEVGLSLRYGASWRERMQGLLERLGPLRLAYLEALLRAADRRVGPRDGAGCTREAR